MIDYIKCNEATDEQIYRAFKEGFSDYMIKISIDQEGFFKHFFGPEGNSRDYSWLAVDDDKPVGLVLGGIRIFDGVKTLRCGTMCVIPTYRKMGVATLLMEKHRKTAREEQCGQMFLECIMGNDRAVAFYEKEGYKNRYHLHYFVMENPVAVQAAEASTESKGAEAIDEISLDDVRALRKESAVHINWQNEMEFLELNNPEFYGIKSEGKIVAAAAVKDTRIQFLYVKEPFRNRGYGRALVIKAAEGREKLTVSFSDNELLAGFYERIGFSKEPIMQHEMYRSVD